MVKIVPSNAGTEHLGEFAKQIVTQFDVTPESAKSNSKGTKGFRTHRLTHKNGTAKTGKLQLTGKCKVDRYISYRVRDQIISLNCFLGQNSADDDAFVFHVCAPKEYLPDGQPLSEIKAGHESETESKLFQWGEAFQNFDDAKSAFVNTMAKVAHAKMSNSAVNRSSANGTSS